MVYFYSFHEVLDYGSVFVNYYANALNLNLLEKTVVVVIATFQLEVVFGFIIHFACVQSD